jgi:hypothetical protein
MNFQIFPIPQLLFSLTITFGSTIAFCLFQLLMCTPTVMTAPYYTVQSSIHTGFTEWSLRGITSSFLRMQNGLWSVRNLVDCHVCQINRLLPLFVGLHLTLPSNVETP